MDQQGGGVGARRPVEEVPISNALRIASVPSDHVYVRHLDPPCGSPDLVRLPDPPVPDAPAGQWWPSPVLEPAWLRAHAATYDLVHVHFGFEHRTPAELAGTVAVLRQLGKPLVLTVHDLANPHLVDQGPHDAALDVLVPAATALVTLTAGAATEIARRWGRAPTVLPHPHVVPLDRIARPRPVRDGFVVGLHTKPRANNDPGAVRSLLADVVTSLPGARLQTELTHRLTDAALWDHLAGLDVLVLAYRFGTHSGFVEACFDLGTVVVAPRVGFLAEQHPVLTYDLGEPNSLAAAVRTAHRDRPRWQADPAERARRREALSAAHVDLYRLALTTTPTTATTAPAAASTAGAAA